MPDSSPQSVRQVRDALEAMRDCGDRAGMYEEAADALVALDSIEEQKEALDKWLRDSAVRAAKNKAEASGEGHTYWQGYENACLDAEIIRDANPASRPES